MEATPWFPKQRLGPYRFVSKDETRTFPNGRVLRFVLYGARDDAGLIGAEHNGIAVLEQQGRRWSIVCERMFSQSCGYNGPSQQQEWMFAMLARVLPWEVVAKIVNEQRQREVDL